MIHMLLRIYANTGYSSKEERMNKKLPINEKPYFRTYAHHGYMHAVIGTNDKVALQDGVIAKVQIEDYQNYNWDIEAIGSQYTIGDDTIELYANKWNIDMNTALWRKCKIDDILSIKIFDQLYSNVWSSIFIFLADDKRVYTDFDSSYCFVFGIFSKDGLFYRGETRKHYTIECLEKCNEIALKRLGREVLLEYVDVGIKRAVSIPLKNASKCKYIGVGFNFRCNDYYEWVFSHYINIYANPFESIHADFLGMKHKNFECHTTNYFIDYNEVYEKTVNGKIVDYIIEMIDGGKYVETLLNDKLNDASLEFDYYHQNLIYGYDDERRIFNVLFYHEGRIATNELNFDDFESKANSLDDRKMYIYNYNPDYRLYELSVDFILQIYDEFLRSKNITYYEHFYDNSFCYGLSAIKNFTSECFFSYFFKRYKNLSFIVLKKQMWFA